METVALGLFGLLILVAYFAIMAVIAIVSYQAKLRSVIKYINQKAANQSNRPRNIKRPPAVIAFILFWVVFLCFGFCLMIITIGRYFDVPWMVQIDSSLLGIIAVTTIIVGIVAAIVGSVFYNYLFKMEE